MTAQNDARKMMRAKCAVVEKKESKDDLSPDKTNVSDVEKLP